MLLGLSVDFSSLLALISAMMIDETALVYFTFCITERCVLDAVLLADISVMMISWPTSSS